jgi:nucleosome binding factor SPN SPT16 subunit
MDFTEDPETMLIQKMSQMCIQTNDYPTNSRNEDAVSTSRMQVLRANRAIEKVKEIQRKKSLTLRESQMMMNNIVPHQALKRKCENTVQVLQTYTRNATPTKVRA